MAYQITRANGTVLLSLQEFTRDTTTTSLTLIGRNVVDYGESIAQNFVYLLENFASPASADLKTGTPHNPMTGQLWFHTTIPGGEPIEKLRVYNGRTNQWMTLNNMIVWPKVSGLLGGPTPPVSTNNSQRPSASLTDLGDLWFDTASHNLYYAKKAGQYTPDGRWTNDKNFNNPTHDSVPKWYHTSTPYTSELPPTCPVDGDLWMSLPERQLWVYDSRMANETPGYSGPEIPDDNGVTSSGASSPFDTRRPMDIHVGSLTGISAQEELDLKKIPKGWVLVGPGSPRGSWTYNKYDWIWGQSNSGTTPGPGDAAISAGLRHHSMQVWVGDSMPSQTYLDAQTPMPDSSGPKLVGLWTSSSFNANPDSIVGENARNWETYSSWAKLNQFHSTSQDAAGNVNWDVGKQFQKGLNLTIDSIVNGTSLNSLRLGHSPADNYLGRTEEHLEPTGITTAKSYPKKTQEVRFGLPTHRWGRYYGSKLTGVLETFTYGTPGDNATRILADDHLAIDVTGNIKSEHMYPYADQSYDLGSGGIGVSFDSRYLASLNNIGNAGNRRWRKIWAQYATIDEFDGDLKPRTDGSSTASTPNVNGFELGTAGRRWATAYMHNLNTNWVASDLRPQSSSFTVGTQNNRWDKIYGRALDVEYFSSSVLPEVPTVNLGSASNRFNEGYFDHININHVDSHLVPQNDGSQPDQNLGSSAKQWNEIWSVKLNTSIIAGDLTPENDQIDTDNPNGIPDQDLGSLTKPWRHAYLNSLSTNRVSSNLIPENDTDGGDPARYPNGFPDQALGSSEKPWGYIYGDQLITNFVASDLIPINDAPDGLPDQNLGSNTNKWAKAWLNKIHIDDDGVESNLSPTDDDTYALGSETKTFSTAYLSRLNVKDKSHETANEGFGVESNLVPTISGVNTGVAGSDVGYSLGESDRLWKKVYTHSLHTVQVDTDLIPESNNAFSLGTTSLRWKNGFLIFLDVAPLAGHGVGIRSTTILPQTEVSGGTHDLGNSSNKWNKAWLKKLHVDDSGIESNLVPNLDCALDDSAGNIHLVTGTTATGVQAGHLLGNTNKRFNTVFTRQIHSGANDLILGSTIDLIGTPRYVKPIENNKINLGSPSLKWKTTYTTDLSIGQYVLSDLIPQNINSGGQIGQDINQNIGSTTLPWNQVFMRQLNVRSPDRPSEVSDTTGVNGNLVPSVAGTDLSTATTSNLGHTHRRWNALYVDIIAGGDTSGANRADVQFVGTDLNETGDVVPATDGVFDLGKGPRIATDPEGNTRYASTTSPNVPRKWRNVWTVNLHADNLIVEREFNMNCNSLIGARSVMPCLSTQSNLGGANVGTGNNEYWSNLYVQNIYGRDGTETNPDDRLVNIKTNAKIEKNLSVLGNVTLGGNVLNSGNIIPKIDTAGTTVVNQATQTLGDPTHYWRALYVANIYTGEGLEIEGPISVNGDMDLNCHNINNSGNITPCGNSVKNLGTANNPWAAVYTAKLSNPTGLDVSSHKIIEGSTRHEGHLYPGVSPMGTPPDNAIWDLGNPTNYWNRLYVKELVSPGSSGLSLGCNGMNDVGHMVPCIDKDLGTVDYPWRSAYVQGLRVDRIAGTVTSGVTSVDFSNIGISNVGNIVPVNDRTLGTSGQHWQTLYVDTLRTTNGTVYGNWTLAAGATWQATYADLAERYEADNEYEPGTVLMIGGEKEVTLTDEDASIDVFGVVATNPAYLLNATAGTNKTHPAVAKVGRIPCRVIGKVKKGQRLCSSNIPGVARAMSREELADSINHLAIIGRALESKDYDEEGKILITVGKN